MAPHYKFGYCVPHMYEEAIKLDLQNGNTKWQDLIKLEMEQLWEYKCFVSHGIHGKDSLSDGYKKRFMCISYLMSSMMVGTRQDALQMGT